MFVDDEQVGDIQPLLTVPYAFYADNASRAALSDSVVGINASTLNNHITNDQDVDAANELQTLSFDSTSGKLLLSINNSEVDLSSLNTGANTVNWNSISNVPSELADGDDNTQLSESEVDAFVDNNGYILTEVDGSITNEIQDLQLSSNMLSITNNGSATDIDLSGYLGQYGQSADLRLKNREQSVDFNFRKWGKWYG